MFGLGEHATFIVLSYGVTVGVILALIAWVVLDGRAQKRLLRELEGRGIRRSGSRE